jgi:hypothetical protein
MLKSRSAWSARPRGGARAGADGAKLGRIGMVDVEIAEAGFTLESEAAGERSFLSGGIIR